MAVVSSLANHLAWRQDGGQAHGPFRLHHRQANQVVALFQRLAGVDADAQRKGFPVYRRPEVSDSQLDLDGTVKCLSDAREAGHQAAALRLDDAAAVSKQLSPHDREVVALELIYLAAIEVIVNRASNW